MSRPTPRYEIGDQSGQFVVVTGASSGLGLQSARRLAAAGAEVLLAVRDADRGERARESIAREHPDALLGTALVDLADLASIEEFGQRLRAEGRAIDVLVNNAGVKVLPERTETVDGFEQHIGTNFLGHFALTGHLLPLLHDAPAPRVVSLGSIAATMHNVSIENLQLTSRYSKMRAYGQSKRACIVFAVELQRRASAHGWNLISTSAHPGYAAESSYAPSVPIDPLVRRIGRVGTELGTLANRALAWGAKSSRAAGLWHTFAEGAACTLYAATDPAVLPGAYIAPSGLAGLAGAPRPANPPQGALDPVLGARLWDVAEELTGVRYLSD